MVASVLASHAAVAMQLSGGPLAAPSGLARGPCLASVRMSETFGWAWDSPATPNYTGRQGERDAASRKLRREQLRDAASEVSEPPEVRMSPSNDPSDPFGKPQAKAGSSAT